MLEISDMAASEFYGNMGTYVCVPFNIYDSFMVLFNATPPLKSSPWHGITSITKWVFFFFF